MSGGSVRSQRAQRYSIGTVTNALTLLGAVAERQVLGLNEAAAVIGVSKSTAFRMLATLEAAGLVERVPESGFRPGVEAIRWATRLLAGLEVRSVALPHMRALRDETGETVNLALVRETGVVYVEIVESPAAFRTAEIPGTLAPVHATALGQAIALHLNPERLEMLLGTEPYDRLTPNTPTSRRDFEAVLAATRHRGYGLDLEAAELGVVCVAAPVLEGGRIAGAISVSGPRARIADERIHDLGRRAVTVAEEVSKRLPRLD